MRQLEVFEWLFLVPIIVVMWVAAIACCWASVEYAYGKLENWLERRKWAKEHEAQQRRLRGNDDDMSGGMGGYA